MTRKAVRCMAAIAGGLFTSLCCQCMAVDSASFEYGSGNHTQLGRVGLQWNWEKQWLQAGGYHLGGYWDLNLAYWHSDRFENTEGAVQNLGAIGFTPVFRYQPDSSTGLYGEAGIGLALLSRLYDNNDRRLSTHYQFGSHLGAGYLFRNGIDLGLRFQHFSNGGFKEPNSGVNFTVLRVGYRF